MAPVVYTTPASPPACAVLMTAKTLGLDVDVNILDFTKGEHKTPEYLKLNPQHTVPTLVDDDGFVIWESHAVMAYLVSKYGKDDALYPKEIRRRAVVDQRLHFESGVAFAIVRKILRPMIDQGKKTIEQGDINGVEEIYGFIETFLSSSGPWIAGNAVTIADFSLIPTITSLDSIVKVNCLKYQRVAAWIKRAEDLPANNINQQHLRDFRALMKQLLA